MNDHGKDGKFVIGSRGHWKGGIYKRKGYTLIFSPDHPFKSKNNYYPEHRLIMEKILGRYLRKDEVVHHIDGDKGNNTRENLMLLDNAKEHKKFHLEAGKDTRFKKGDVSIRRKSVDDKYLLTLQNNGLSSRVIGRLVGLDKSNVLKRIKKYVTSSS